MAWVVENFQVPVPIGDCSFHFLFKESQGLFTKATLQYAFIMDGGKNSAKRKADDAIKSTLGLARNLLSTKYGIAANKIVFNAWVVTHWDSDHYVGVNSLLNSGNNVWFKETFSANPKLYCGRCTGFDKKLVEMMVWYILRSHDQVGGSSPTRQLTPLPGQPLRRDRWRGAYRA